MKVSLQHLLAPIAIAWLCLCQVVAVAQEPAQPASPPAPAEPAEPAQAPAPADTAQQVPDDVDWIHYEGGDDVILHVGHDAHLAANRSADAVISIFGSATSAGKVGETVVSIFGNTRATGPVGEGAVAVFGDTYVNGRVGEAAIAVFGNVELGPEADIHGDVVAVGGTVTRDPRAVVHGDVEEISFGGAFGQMQWLHTWVKHGLLYGRPLAFEPGLGWAWGLAFGFLALYVLIALLFAGSVEKCCETLETQPGQSVIASLLAMLLTPIVIVLLLATVVGIVVVPFVGMAIFCAGLFGKAVVLAAIGRRVTNLTGINAFGHIAFAVLVGGIIVLGLYVVPVIGFITYKLTGILGLGVVVYTLLLATRARRANSSGPQSPAPAPTGPAGPADPGATSRRFEAAAAAAAATANAGQSIYEAPQMAGATAGGIPGGTQGVSGSSGPSNAAGPAESAAASDASPASTAPEPSAAPPSAALALPRAGFWIRMAALLIDVVLLAIIVSMLNVFDDIFLLLLAVYGAVMWKLKGTTVGGIVCNLRVVRLDGREISWDTAVVRALGCFLSLAFAGLGFFWIAFDEDRQSWHDKIAGTLVVRAPRGAALV